ncbi:MAG: polysaccharide deacetylase family protein [Pseudobdellovibrionaceae bacterium]
MKRNFMKLIHSKMFGPISALLLVGCGNQISRNVQQAVIDNQSVQSLSEWELSEANPTNLFEKWRKQIEMNPSRQQQIEKDICTELNKLDGQSLSIFENEIRDKKNRPLLTICQEDLYSKLENYYKEERQKLAVSTNALELTPSANNFQFQPNVQHRDVSDGYFAFNGDIATKEVILSFDDGPSALYTPSVLQSLREVKARVHFFELGKNVKQNPELVKKVAAEGHAIGSHSTTHACLGTSGVCQKINGRILSFDEAIDEIKVGHQAIYDVLGWVEPFFRFPYGESSAELKNFLKTNSTGEFYWSIDSNDWRAQSNEGLLNNTLNQLEAHKKGLILMHDIQRRTAEILPQFLHELYFRGYSIVLLQPSDPGARFNSKLVKRKLP